MYLICVHYNFILIFLRSWLNYSLLCVHPHFKWLIWRYKLYMYFFLCCKKEFKLVLGNWNKIPKVPLMLHNISVSLRLKVTGIWWRIKEKDTNHWLGNMSFIHLWQNDGYNWRKTQGRCSMKRCIQLEMLILISFKAVV